jgi:chromosome segregation ATPase
MFYGKLVMSGILASALLGGACNKAEEPGDAAVRTDAPAADAAAERQQERSEEISRLETRVVEIERDYAEAKQEVVDEKKTPTAGLREELKEDVSNVKQAVNDLRTTTPENWWDRHEQAMKRTANDIEADVARLAGKVTPARPATTTDADGEQVSTEPFTSRRDNFVASMRTRVAAMEQALDKVNASGPRKTEVEDVSARVKKLGEDADRLNSASADDWWDVTKARVTDYVDRIEGSVKRLDDRG